MTEAFDPYRKWLGIPPEEQPPNKYRLLGIALYESDPDVIHHAGDRQMTHLRTFQGGKHGEHSQKLLNEVSAARVLLLNPEKKAEYDAQLRQELAPPVATAAAPPAAPPPPPPAAGAPPQGKSVSVNASPAGITPVVKTAGRARSTSYAKSRKKKSAAPLIVGILAVGGIAIAGVLLLLLGGGQQAARQPGQGTNPAPRASSPISQFKPPEPRAPLRTTPAPPPRQFTPPDEPAPEDPLAGGNNLPERVFLSPAEMEAQHVEERLATARESLLRRDLRTAEQKLRDLKPKAEEYGHLAEYEHLEVLRYYLDQFWSQGVRPGIRAMEPGESFEFGGDTVELVEYNELTNMVTYEYQGEEVMRDPRLLPTMPAVALAWRGFLRDKTEAELTDKFPYIYTAAFLLMDANSEVPLEQRQKLAQEYLAAGAAAGDSYVAKELAMQQQADGEPAESEPSES